MFPTWPARAALVVESVMWLLPWSATLAFLVNAHGLARRNQDFLESVTRDRDMVRTLIDSLPDYIYAKDAQCRFTLANAFCCERMGTTPAGIIGKTDFEFYPPELARRFVEDEERVLRSGDPLLSRQEDVVDHAGKAFTILTTKVPWKDNRGNVVGIIGIGRDITKRVQAERLLATTQAAMEKEMRERERMAIELRLAQKLEAVGRLASGVAHEINTPVQYIGDSVYFLRSAFEDLSQLLIAYREATIHCPSLVPNEETLERLRQLEEASDYEFLSVEVPKAIERSLEGTQRVASIVRAMKEFAHPDANEHKVADINRALTTTLTLARSEYRHAAKIETDFGDTPELLCNVGELNQVFLNLIVNAAHAIADAGKDSESGLIRVQTRTKDGSLLVTIQDNGTGIAADNLEKIFDPFFTTKEVGRGTGQGLAITRAIVVEKHGGTINVSSEVGTGTAFELSFPLKDQAQCAH